MTLARQSFVNDKDGPIYVSIEPNPECYELEPGQRLTLIYTLPVEGDGLETRFINERELLVWPTELVPEPTVLIDGVSADGRSWKFKRT